MGQWPSDTEWNVELQEEMNSTVSRIHRDRTSKWRTKYRPTETRNSRRTIETLWEKMMPGWMNIGPNLWQCNSDEFSSFRCSSAQLSLLNPSLGYLLINLFICNTLPNPWLAEDRQSEWETSSKKLVGTKSRCKCTLTSLLCEVVRKDR